MSFENFANLNHHLGLTTHRKDLQRVFKIIDRQKTKRVRVEDIKSISSLIASEEQDVLPTEDEENHQRLRLKGLALCNQIELNDIYALIKERLETTNKTFEKVIYDDLKH